MALLVSKHGDHLYFLFCVRLYSVIVGLGDAIFRIQRVKKHIMYIKSYFPFTPKIPPTLFEFRYQYLQLLFLRDGEPWSKQR